MRLKVTAVPELSTATRCSSFVAQQLAIGDEARIRDRRRAARSHLSVDFSDSGLITLSPPNALDRMSKIDRHSDFTPSPSARQQRFLARALGCGVEELVAQLGQERDQARRNRSATRQARPLPKASYVLERRESRDRGPKPGIDGNGRKRRPRPSGPHPFGINSRKRPFGLQPLSSRPGPQSESRRTSTPRRGSAKASTPPFAAAGERKACIAISTANSRAQQRRFRSRSEPLAPRRRPRHERA